MIIKYIHVILLASVKYFFTLPYAMIIGLDYKQTVIAVLIGGIGGILFFYYLSKPLIRGIDILWPKFCRMSPPVFRIKYEEYCKRKLSDRTSKIFTKRNRFIARIKKTYGLWGIIITTPLFLTIPVGAFLANKYYSKRKHIVLYLILSIVGWTVVFSGIVLLFPNVFL